MKKGLCLLFLVALISSCITKRDYYYFSKKNATVSADSLHSNVRIAEIPTHLLSEGDELEIDVNAINTVVQENNNRGAQNATIVKPTYVITYQGYINLPSIGNFYVKGRTIQSLQDTLLKVYQKFFNEPFVSVNLKSFKIVVMGEVRIPGVKIVNSDHVTILEALSMSGDLTEDAKRVNIKVLRKNDADNTIKEYSVDLASVSFFNSDVYYLHGNDVVYVSQISAKRYLTRAQSIAISLTAVNTIFIVLNNFIKL